MKVFLIFIGLLMIQVGFISYQGDLARYLKMSADIKALAEECAVGAAQYYDEAAYGQGLMVINQTEATKLIAYLAGLAADRLGLQDPSALTWQLHVTDDQTAAASAGPPVVTVEMQLQTPDLFRLSLIEVRQIKRSARYELAHF